MTVWDTIVCIHSLLDSIASTDWMDGFNSKEFLKSEFKYLERSMRPDLGTESQLTFAKVVDESARYIGNKKDVT